MAIQESNAFLLDDTLYCSEEHWEEDVLLEEDGEDDAVDKISYSNVNHELNTTAPRLLEQDLVWEEEELICLLSKEQQNGLHKSLQTNLFLAEARKESIEWMLKVIAHYSFSTLTAILAVDYLDRFLSTFQFQREKPWMTQLVSVACVSLAAKVEETHVPLLLDLQVEENKYVFEAKTINRMEILVLSSLHWRLNPVTPLSFVDFMSRRLGFKDHLCFEFLRRCERTLLSLISDSSFMRFLPSVMATATMLYVFNCIEPCLGVKYQKQLSEILRIDKEEVDKCYRRILEASQSSGCDFGMRYWNKRKYGSIPGSPDGVIDMSFSSDSSNDSWSIVPPSVTSSPENFSKRVKLSFAT